MTLLPEVQQELHDAAARRAKEKADGALRVPLSLPGVWRSGLRAAPLALGILTVVAVAVLALGLRHGHGHANLPATTAAPSHGPRPPRPSHRPTPQSPAQREVNAAQSATDKRDRACAQHYNEGASFNYGPPGNALLSALGVLRRPAPPPSAAVLRRLGFSAGSGVYINYIRRARTVFGRSFYIIPEGHPGGRVPVPHRCYAETIAALRLIVRHAPVNDQRTAIKIESEEFTSQQTVDRDLNSLSICFDVLSTHSNNIPGGGCKSVTDFFAAYTEGLDTGQVDSAGGTILSGVVPDGVATLTVDYAAAHGMPARTLNASVVNNVVVVKVPPRTANQPFPHRVIWRAANGRVIRTFG